MRFTVSERGRRHDIDPRDPVRRRRGDRTADRAGMHRQSDRLRLEFHAGPTRSVHGHDFPGQFAPMARHSIAGATPSGLLADHRRGGPGRSPVPGRGLEHVAAPKRERR